MPEGLLVGLCLGLHGADVNSTALPTPAHPCPPLHHCQVADVLRASGLAACGPVLLLHFFGYLLGYLLPRLLGFNEKTSRTGGGGVEL